MGIRHICPFHLEGFLLTLFVSFWFFLLTVSHIFKLLTNCLALFASFYLYLCLLHPHVWGSAYRFGAIHTISPRFLQTANPQRTGRKSGWEIRLLTLVSSKFTWFLWGWHFSHHLHLLLLAWIISHSKKKTSLAVKISASKNVRPLC